VNGKKDESLARPARAGLEAQPPSLQLRRAKGNTEIREKSQTGSTGFLGFFFSQFPDETEKQAIPAQVLLRRTSTPEAHRGGEKGIDPYHPLIKLL